MGRNFFSDPKGNVLNIEFEESLIYYQIFRVSNQILNFCNLKEIYYACTVFYGGRNFNLQIFSMDWREIENPVPTVSILPMKPFCSSSFFTSFVVRLCPLKVCSFIIVGLQFTVIRCLICLTFIFLNNGT